MSKKQQFNHLSEEAKEVIQLILNSPTEILELIKTPKQNRITRTRVKKYFSTVWHSKFITEKTIEEIEETLDTSIVKIGYDMNEFKSLKFKTIKVIIWAGLRGHYRDIGKVHLAPKIEKVGEVMFNAGIINQSIIETIGQFLMCAITTPDEIKSQEAALKKKAIKKIKVL